MRVYNRLVISLVLAFSLINVALACFGQEDIGIYFIANALAYLIITLLYMHLNPRARTGLNSLSVVVFAGFLVIVAVKVMEILS
ncbi:MAG: hypothetical protein PHU23_10380 [Dehalococcoidales bacterium]|nr:hypothetical protein [Dehalococcoidales bacterium]